MASVSRVGKSTEVWFTPDLTDWVPANVKAKSFKKRIYVSWDQPLVNNVLHPDIIGYRIYRSTDDSTYVPIGTISKSFPRAFTFLIDMDLGKQYFKVATVFKHQYESAKSDSASVVHGEGYGD